MSQEKNNQSGGLKKMDTATMGKNTMSVRVPHSISRLPGLLLNVRHK